jgi:uncharacterized protein YndB with AHSA1/START domain
MLQETRKSEPRAVNSTTVERTSDRELVIQRAFNGRARTVFDALTKPELLERWWAPRSLGVTLFECESDARVGGAYRFVFGHDAANAVAFSGTYKEVTPHSRLVFTQIFEPMRSAGEGVITITLEEREGQTHMVQHGLYPSKEALDGAIGSGMERGLRNSLDQLDELVASQG